eukprot:1257686-Rhodomonas_salina.3
MRHRLRGPIPRFTQFHGKMRESNKPARSCWGGSRAWLWQCALACPWARFRQLPWPRSTGPQPGPITVTRSTAVPTETDRTLCRCQLERQCCELCEQMIGMLA